MILEQAVAGKTAAQIKDMADNLERIADAKAAAATKAKAKAAAAAAKAKVAGANAAQVKAAATAANANAAGATQATVAKTATAGAATKSGASMVGTCCSSKGWALGLGLGLGPWGPVLLTAGGAAAGWYVYKNYVKGYLDNRADAPSI